MLLLPVAFYLLPEWVILDSPSVCLYKNITGEPCYGCGTVHSWYYIFHGDLFHAFEHNHTGIVTFSILSIIYINEFWKTLKKYLAHPAT